MSDFLTALTLALAVPTLAWVAYLTVGAGLRVLRDVLRWLLRLPDW